MAEKKITFTFTLRDVDRGGPISEADILTERKIKHVMASMVRDALCLTGGELEFAPQSFEFVIEEAGHAVTFAPSLIENGLVTAWDLASRSEVEDAT